MSSPCSSHLPVAWRDGGSDAWGWHDHEGSPHSPFSARTAAGIAWETASSEDESCEGQPFETEVDMPASARRSLDASMESLHDSCHGETRVGDLLKRDRAALARTEPASACSWDSSLASLSGTASLGACCSSVEGLADSLCDFRMAVSSAQLDSSSKSISCESESPAKRLRLRPIAPPESEALPRGQHPPPPPPTPLGTPGRLERRCQPADWEAEDERERAGGEEVRHLSQETEALGLVLTRPHQRPLGPLPLTLKRRKVSTMSGGLLSPSSHSWASLSVSGTLMPDGLCGDEL